MILDSLLTVFWEPGPFHRAIMVVPWERSQSDWSLTKFTLPLFGWVVD